MENHYRGLLELLRAGDTVAQATVVSTRGSTPREAGAKMLVWGSGAIAGTVGGGCGEAEVWRAALQVIETGRPQLVWVDLTGEISQDSAAVCGGTMEVLVDRWAAGADSTSRPSDLAVAELLLERVGRREPCVLATAVAGGEGVLPMGGRVVVGQGGILLGGLGSEDLDRWLLRESMPLLRKGGCLTVVPGDAAAGQAPVGGVRLFLEAVKSQPLLAILGAGHIAQPLATLGKLLGFTVAVLDDRASFANAERFPEADLVLACGFEDGLGRLPLGRDSHVVLVTRGHQHDVECLRRLAFADLAYLGMIGSRRRVRAVFELLGEEGVPAERLASVHAPIGVDIGAQTPAEIAVSIAAELVKVRRGGEAASLSDRRV